MPRGDGPTVRQRKGPPNISRHLAFVLGLLAPIYGFNTVVTPTVLSFVQLGAAAALVLLVALSSRDLRPTRGTRLFAACIIGTAVVHPSPRGLATALAIATAVWLGGQLSRSSALLSAIARGFVLGASLSAAIALGELAGLPSVGAGLSPGVDVAGAVGVAGLAGSRAGLGFASALAAALAYGGSPLPHKLLNSGVLFILMLATATSGSRIGLVGVLLMFAAGRLGKGRTTRATVRQTLLLVALYATALATGIGLLSLDRLIAVADSEPDSGGRLEIVEEVLDSMDGQMVAIGNGLHVSPAQREDGHDRLAHNAAINALWFGGIPLLIGTYILLVANLARILSGLRKSPTTPSEYRGAALLFLVYTLGALLANQPFSSSGLLLIAVAHMARARRGGSSQ
ncbi:MAG: hypothetical protein GY724_30180 [Actinomycetia bacterium]|nr:hypothetical protein [Actinomycetes bacterium]